MLVSETTWLSRGCILLLDARCTRNEMLNVAFLAPLFFSGVGKRTFASSGDSCMDCATKVCVLGCFTVNTVNVLYYRKSQATSYSKVCKQIQYYSYHKT